MMPDPLDSPDAAVDRRKSPIITANSAWMFLVAIVVLCVVGVAAIVALTVWQPEKDQTATITLIRAFIEPITIALLAGAGVQFAKAVDGRFSQLLAMTARTHAAEGQLVGQAQAEQKIAALPEVVVAKVVTVPVVESPDKPTP